MRILGGIIHDASIIRLRPNSPNHIWSVDFVADRLSNGRPYRMLTVLDEYTREALGVVARPSLKSADVIEALYGLFLKHGKPQYLRSDNGSEFTAKAFTTWLKAQGIKPVTILPGSPWENGYNERFNGTLRKELLNAEWFHSMHHARTAIKSWLRQYNTIRPHQSLNMRPPTPEILDQTGP